MKRISFASLFGILLLAALVAFPAGASAAGSRAYTRTGNIYACFKAKGPAKGNLRVVRKKQKCRHGERKINWSTGKKPAGSQPGASTIQGLQSSVDSQRSEIEKLNNRLKESEEKIKQVSEEASKLHGITVLQLEAALLNSGKLGAIGGLELTEALAAVPKVNALCNQVPLLGTNANELLTGLEGIHLGGVIPLNLELKLGSLPTALTPFTCG